MSKVIALAENIKRFRRERAMTQEKLAEVLGVTPGAVYKWESNKATPELSLIVEMALLFETSVDVLLGYDWRKSTMGETLDSIRSYKQNKSFKEGTAFVERALVKFPNSFDIVYESAWFYFLSFEKEKVLRAIELFRRSEELIDQNQDIKVNVQTIENSVANGYMFLGDSEKAIEILKKNNFGGINNCALGFYLSTEKSRKDEAKEYLSEALMDYIVMMDKIANGFANIYFGEGKYDSAIDVFEISVKIMEMFKKSGTPSFLDKHQSFLYAGCAIITNVMKDGQRTRDYLNKAWDLAVRYDAKPDDTLKNIKFYSGKDTSSAYDDFGDTAIKGIEKVLAQGIEEGVPKGAEDVFDVWSNIKEKRGER